MFFTDETIGAKKKETALRVPPPIPETNWRPPTSFPNLSGAVTLSVDTETKDPQLLDFGPGWARGKGHIVGFSVGAVDRLGNRGKWYFPVRHELEPEYNLDPRQCFSWLKDQLETPHIPKVFANAMYDIGWLAEENVNVSGQIHDTEVAEALLNSDGFVGLDHLGLKYCNVGKDTGLLYEWLAKAYGGPANSSQRKNIYRSPPRLVGPYAEQDADLPLQVLEKQWPLMAAEELLELYKMECDSLPLLIAMRQTGVNIDLRGAEILYSDLAIEVSKLEEQLYQISGVRANVNSGADLAKLFDAVNVEYPRTDKGNPSFTKEWLTASQHPVSIIINTIREMEKIRGTFIKSYLLESNVNGRVHCQFHPLRGDEGGTITGRFSSSAPNLQNIPSRTELGKQIRKLFIPDYGHAAWTKKDYSQIEYRMLAHFAVGPMSDELRKSYIDDPKTDYHVIVQQNVKKLTNIDIPRKPIKNINFGLMYGQSEKGLAYKAGFNEQQAKDIMAAYHAGAPYVKPTMAAIADEVHQHGFTRTVLNRRTRFNMWEPKGFRKDDDGNRAIPLPFAQAASKYGSNIIRAGAYRGVNYKLQGSAADIIKNAMVKAWKAGIFNVTGVPKLQVHDELDFSVIDYSAQQVEAYRELDNILETSTALKIPVKVESGYGPNWGVIE